MDGPSQDGAFHTQLNLGQGRYEYKFVINGDDWRPDPAAAQRAGYFRNSVLDVPATRSR